MIYDANPESCALQQRNTAAQIESQVDRDLLVARASGVQTTSGIAQALDEQSLDEAVDALESSGVPRMEAIKQVARRRGLSKREVYAQLLHSPGKE